jgi:general nucleoside transport system ATP-binding protein
MELSGMCKRFGALVALDDVSLRLPAGSYHALLGENGAGKSTLVKCVMGYHQPDAGKVVLDGGEQRIASPRDAYRLGIGMVYQHFTLVPSMTVAENLMLARADLPRVLNWRTEMPKLERFLEGMPFKIDLSAPAGGLAAGEKQKIEIVKQLFLGSRILILDEPTSVLTPGEADDILGLLHQMTKAEQLSVLLITHKLREVMAYCDRVTVLRHGRNVGGGRVKDITADMLAEMMVGKGQIAPPAARVPYTGRDSVRLELKGLCADNEKGHQAVAAASLSVRAGEILGIAGVSGNGQKEMIEVLAGQRESTAGAVLVHGKPFSATRAELRREKVFCLQEEPLRNSCVANMSVADNLAFRDFDRPPNVRAGWFVNERSIRARARELIAQYRIKTYSPAAPVATLSGGNVQRLVLARELSGEVSVLIAVNPCFGIDIAAITEIRGQIMRVRNRGAAVLLISEDLDELFELADRILVMFEGSIVYETGAATADRMTISSHMAGH